MSRMPALAALPELPANDRETKQLQAEVDLRLWEAVEKEMAKQGKRSKKKLKNKEVVEWGLKAYLAKTNPEALMKLGFSVEK